MHRMVRLSLIVALGLCAASCASLQYALMPSSHLKIEAEDGTWVACDVYDKGRPRVLLISPGFLQHKRSAGIRELTQALQHDYDVIGLDYRGTGESSGWYAYTARETKDLHAVLQFAKRRWPKVGVVGVSLGAAIALNELAAHPEEAQSLVTISAPMAFDAMEKDVSPTARFTALTEASWSIRSDNPFLPKRDPIDQIGRLTIPVLFIHGGQDHVIFERHSRQLYERAAGPKRLLLFPTAGHAHELILAHLDECARAIREWFDQTLR